MWRKSQEQRGVCSTPQRSALTHKGAFYVKKRTKVKCFVFLFLRGFKGDNDFNDVCAVKRAARHFLLYDNNRLTRSSLYGAHN